MPRRTDISSILVAGVREARWVSPMVKTIGGLSTVVFLAACDAKTAAPIDRAFVISSEEVGFGGIYLRSSPNGEAVPDVDGNLLEDVMGCAFTDLRVVAEPGRLHGSGFAIWIPEREMTDLQRQCLRRELPPHAKMHGPVPVSELREQAGS